MAIAVNGVKNSRCGSASIIPALGSVSISVAKKARAVPFSTLQAASPASLCCVKPGISRASGRTSTRNRRINVSGTQVIEFRTGLNSEERERLLLEHLPQVRYLARRIHDRLPAQVLLDDLIHAGVIGLIDAVDKFDPAKNVQLKTYAKFRIRGSILDSLREMDWSPRRLRREARRIEEAHRDLRMRLGRVAGEPELAAELGMNLAEFQHLLGELRGLDIGSLQVEATCSWAEDELVIQGPSGPEKDPFASCLHEELKSLVSTALEDLEVKEKQVVTLYYLEELTMKEVGAVLGVGESRVSQIHSAALIRLRARLEEILPAHPRSLSDSRAPFAPRAGTA